MAKDEKFKSGHLILQFRDLPQFLSRAHRRYILKKSLADGRSFLVREARSTPPPGSRTRRFEWKVKLQVHPSILKWLQLSASASGSLNRTFPTSSQFRSVIPVGRSNSRTPSPGVTQQYATPTTAKKSIRKSVALCKPKILRGKIVLDEVISTHFVSFTEEQASTAEIAEMVSSQVENEAAVTLVDSKFLEVPETATG